MSGIGIRTPPRVIRILALVVESGMLYIFIGVSSACLVLHHGHTHEPSRVFFSRQVVTLVSPFIHLPFGTLSNIFALLTSQLAVRNHL